MSIQPNRVIQRIIDQVDRSDWPPLTSAVFGSAEALEILRFYRVPKHGRYATPLHFWVHALREELQATDHREDLANAACHALGQEQPFSDWLGELDGFTSEDGRDLSEVLDLGEFGQSGIAPNPPRIYRMLGSGCRRSSVVDAGDSLMAHFWGHGSRVSWRRKSIC